MKSRVFLLLTIVLLGLGLINAKTGKVKYGKYIVYEGEVVNKEPMGLGRLSLISPSDKKNMAMVIAGDFNGNKVVNATVKSAILPEMTFPEKNAQIEFIPEGEKGKADRVTFSFPEFTSSNSNGMTYTVDSLKILFSIANKGWNVQSFPQKFKVKTNFCYCPDVVEKYWGWPKRIEYMATLNNGHFEISSDSSMLFYDDYCYIDKDDTFYHLQNGKVSSDSKFKIGKNGETWSGVRLLPDGTEISGDEDEVVVRFRDMTYSGTLDDPMQPVISSLKSFNELHFDNGVLRNSDGSIRYINGESEDVIKSRLVNARVEDDLIDEVLDGDITEQEAVSTQRDRERIAAENKKLAELMHSKWNCDEILFSGATHGTSDGDQVLNMIFNIDHTYFEGKAMLALDSKGEGVFAVIVEPAAKVYNMSRPQQMQVMDVCQKLLKNIQGRWSIDGNDILIDGNQVAKLSADGKSVIYEGMLGSKMTIEEKR